MQVTDDDGAIPGPTLCSGTVGYKRRTFVGSPLWMVRSEPS